MLGINIIPQKYRPPPKKIMVFFGNCHFNEIHRNIIKYQEIRKNYLPHYICINSYVDKGSSLNGKQYFIKESGIKETGLDSLIKAGYKILKLETFFTSGPEETRAWTIQKETKAIRAAGIIHSDFEKGFIKAETVSYEDFVSYNGYNEAKNNGKLRLEGKDYIVQDGDILLFRFNT